MKKLTQAEPEATAAVEQPTDALPEFVPDAMLCARWHWSPVTLWRARRKGLLPPGIKLSPGRNSTRREVILAHEKRREQESVASN